MPRYLRKTVETATLLMFLYQNKLYEQIGGIAVGSPLLFTFANFFLAHLENKFLNRNQLF